MFAYGEASIREYSASFLFLCHGQKAFQKFYHCQQREVRKKLMAIDNGQWFFGGLKKEYKISKHVKGNLQIVYNINDYIFKSSQAAYGIATWSEDIGAGSNATFLRPVVAIL